MAEVRASLDADMSLKLADFARACKAALRAVSLYPSGHPAIGTTLGRLTELSATLTASFLPGSDQPPVASDPAIASTAAQRIAGNITNRAPRVCAAHPS